jgi:DNA-binding Xre family transcriptional regulator
MRKKRKSIQIPKSSIVLNLKPILAARNIIHPSAFLIKIGINPTSGNKMLRGEAVQINFDQLTKLCLNLNCEPNELFALREMQLPEQHALHNIKPLAIAEDPANITKWLAGKSVEEIRELMKS